MFFFNFFCLNCIFLLPHGQTTGYKTQSGIASTRNAPKVCKFIDKHLSMLRLFEKRHSLGLKFVKLAKFVVNSSSTSYPAHPYRHPFYRPRLDIEWRCDKAVVAWRLKPNRHAVKPEPQGGKAFIARPLLFFGRHGMNRRLKTWRNFLQNIGKEDGGK